MSDRDLVDRLFDEWRRSGLTVAVEAAAEIGTLSGMVTLAEDREIKLRNEVHLLTGEVVQLKELVRRLFRERNSARLAACESIAAGSRGALNVSDIATQMGWNLQEGQ